MSLKGENSSISHPRGLCSSLFYHFYLNQKTSPKKAMTTYFLIIAKQIAWFQEVVMEFRSRKSLEHYFAGQSLEGQKTTLNFCNGCYSDWSCDANWLSQSSHTHR